MLPPSGGERVELGAAVVLGESPLGGDPASILEAAQGGVERALLDRENVVGRVLDPAGDGVAMRGAGEERFENENAEGALEELA